MPFGGTNRIIGKSAQKSQNISVVMVFRRSLVRELTATAIALFLVLLGILFTNLVLRLLARAAGGTACIAARMSWLLSLAPPGGTQ